MLQHTSPCRRALGLAIPTSSNSYLEQRFPQQRTTSWMQVATCIVTAAHTAGVCRMKRRSARVLVILCNEAAATGRNGYGGC